jgi:two-component system nitrogen regulation response regulator GlnG
VIIISAQNSVMTAIKASEYGAYDYLPKPFDLKDLLSKVSRALNQTNTPAIHGPETGSRALPLVGSSAPMQDVYRVVARVLNTDLNVMIMGESGTGKNLLATTLHELGHRSAAPLISLSSAGGRLDILLDADKTPNGATVYLDEIAEMSMDAQWHLLELMQSPQVQDKNLRYISSTQKPLADLMNEGLFREDLFYRLSVMPITLPPLRQRLDDIAELTLHFLQNAADHGQAPITIDADALKLMRKPLWPGNVRELQNFVRRLAVLCIDGNITAALVAEALQQMPTAKNTPQPLKGEKLSSAIEMHLKRYFDLHGDQLPPPGLYNRILHEMELPLIALSLSATRGNQIKTAELLGINRNTLRKKIQEHDIRVTRTKKMM